MAKVKLNIPIRTPDGRAEAGDVVNIPAAQAEGLIRLGKAEEVATDDDLYDKTVAELQELARERNVSGYSGVPKEQLIKILKEDYKVK